MHSLSLALLVTMLLVAAGIEVAAGDSLTAYIGFPGDGAILKYGASQQFGGCAIGTGDHTVCYQWRFTDTGETVSGEVEGADHQFEIAIPTTHTCTVTGTMFAVELKVWWKKDGPGTASYALHTFSVVDLSITSETETRPDPRNRQSLGIGERTTCTAVCVPNGEWTFHWRTTAGSLSATTGTSSVLSAPMAAGGATVTVSLEVPTSTGIDATRSFTVITPTGDSFSNPHDPLTYALGPDWMGCQAVWDVHTQPQAVSFHHAAFREHLPGAVDYTWPNGTHYHQGFSPEPPPGGPDLAMFLLYSVTTDDTRINYSSDTQQDVYFHNANWDGQPVSLLHNNGANAFQWSWDIGAEWSDGQGNWQGFSVTTYSFDYAVNYSATPSTSKGGAGPAQGPFANP